MALYSKRKIRSWLVLYLALQGHQFLYNGGEINMKEQIYSLFMPNINLMGFDAALKVGEQAQIFGGNKAFIVTDKNLVKSGIPYKIKDNLEQSDIESIIWDGTDANPTDKNIKAGLEAYNGNNCNIIISVGGGSPHDCAKGIRIIADNGGNIRDYEGMNKIQKSVTPLIAVNTTAGTGSEITRFCIITDTARKIKMAIIDWRCTPNVSINDPVLTMKMPPTLTAATGMDALTHAIEAYISTIATPATDSFALKAIELISKWLLPSYANGDNMKAREKMIYAQFLAGAAFNNASLGAVHAMAHQLGGYYDLPHGMCNAILLPHICKFNMISNPHRFAKIAKTLGENICGLSEIDAAQKAIEAIKKLMENLNIHSNLSGFGVKEQDLEIMATNALKDACIATNPRPLTLQDVINLYKEAL
jgi:alcohol dehydrogenase